MPTETEFESPSLISGKDALQRGEKLQAKRLFSRATTEDPRSAEAWYLLGLALSESGQLREAAGALEQACQLKPGHALYLVALADVYMDAGAFEYACPMYQKYLRLCPHDAVAWGRLAQGIVYSPKLAPKSRKELAEPCLARSLELDFSNAGLCVLVGGLQNELGLLESAAISFGRAAELAPAEILPLYNLGTILQKLGQHDAARQALEHVLTLEPGVPEAEFALANVLVEQGDFATAARHYAAASNTHPQSAKVLYNWSTIHKFQSHQDALAKALTQLSSSKGLSNGEAALHAFALGKLHDDLNEFDRAFPYFEEGNRLLGSQFDPVQHTQWIDATLQVSQCLAPNAAAIRADVARLQSSAGTNPTADNYQSSRDGLAPFPRPIFIVSMPRAGSTLVERQLSAFPRTHLLGERTDFEGALQNLCQLRGWQILDPDNLLRATAADFAELGLAYLRSVSEKAPAGTRLLVDKLPGNFLFVNWIALALPGARFIHVRRDPRDTCLSCYLQPYEGGMSFCNSLPHLAKFYVEYDRLMQYWNTWLYCLEHATAADGPGRGVPRQSPPDARSTWDSPEVLPWHVVDYETLVEVPTIIQQRLANYLEVDLSSQAASPNGSVAKQATIRTASHWQARQAIHRGSVRRWQNYARHLGPLLEGLEPVLAKRVATAEGIAPPKLAIPALANRKMSNALPE